MAALKNAVRLLKFELQRGRQEKHVLSWCGEETGRVCELKEANSMHPVHWCSHD